MAKPHPKPKLTDEERHVRFVEMAKEVGASDDPEDFERAFEKVTAASRERKIGDGDVKRPHLDRDD
jgi:hypothetical protein